MLLFFKDQNTYFYFLPLHFFVSISVGVLYALHFFLKLTLGVFVKFQFFTLAAHFFREVVSSVVDLCEHFFLCFGFDHEGFLFLRNTSSL